MASMQKKIESFKKKEDVSTSVAKYEFCPECGAKAGEPNENYVGNHIYLEHYCENCGASWYLDYVFTRMVRS